MYNKYLERDYENEWVIEFLDKETKKIGITRQSIYKSMDSWKTKGKNIVTILWKIYFWLIIGLHLLIIGVFTFAEEINYFETDISFLSATYDILIILISIFSLLGLYGYIFKKKYLSKEIWKFIFLLLLIDSVGEFIYLLLEKDYISMSIMAIFIPYFYALYKYAFQGKSSEVSVNG